MSQIYFLFKGRNDHRRITRPNGFSRAGMWQKKNKMNT